MPKVIRNITDIRAECRKYGGSAVKTIVALMTSKDVPAQTRLSAAQYITDRAYGKAPQTIEVDHKDERQTDQILSRIDEIMARSMQLVRPTSETAIEQVIDVEPESEETTAPWIVWALRSRQW